MTKSDSLQSRPGAAAPDGDSAVAALRQLEEARGNLFNEVEYREIRRSIVEELAKGAQFRPFTYFTFGTVGLGLLALLLVGLWSAQRQELGDYLLALACAVALVVWGFVFWRFHRTITADHARRLDQRLTELEELRAQHLLTNEEYDYVHANILISRQRSRDV